MIAALLMIALTQPSIPTQQVPQPVEEHQDPDWKLFLPTTNRHRITQTCPLTGKVGAEFKMEFPVISVVDIFGAGHAMTRADRAAINAAVAKLGSLQSVRVGCAGKSDFIVSVYGSFDDTQRGMRQRLVEIVWSSKGLHGVRGRPYPVLEHAAGKPTSF